MAVFGIGNETKAAESCDCGCEGEVHIFYDDSDEVPYDVLVNYNADSDTFCVPIMIDDTFYADSEHKRYARNEFIEFMKDYDYEYADSQTALTKTYRMQILVAPGVNVDIYQTKESEVMPDETITENTMQNVDETYEEYTEEQATKFDTEETEGSVHLEEEHKGNSEPWIIVFLVVVIMIFVSIITAIVFLLKKR